MAWLEEYLERQHQEANDKAEDHRPRPAASLQARPGGLL
jgi:hypothetical protein